MKNKRQLVAIILIVVFVGGFIVISMIDGFNKVAKPADTRKPSQSSTQYEPQFTKEGELWFIDEETNDTIQQFDIEFAESDYEIETGMMYRKSIPKNTGMLFVFNDSRPRSFWMKNCFVSLDMVFIATDSTVVSIQKNTPIQSELSQPSEGPAQYVLEIEGGMSDAIGIEKGDKIIFRKTDS